MRRTKKREWKLVKKAIDSHSPQLRKIHARRAWPIDLSARRALRYDEQESSLIIILQRKSRNSSPSTLKDGSDRGYTMKQDWRRLGERERRETRGSYCTAFLPTSLFGLSWGNVVQSSLRREARALSYGVSGFFRSLSLSLFTPI